MSIYLYNSIIKTTHSLYVPFENMISSLTNTSGKTFCIGTSYMTD